MVDHCLPLSDLDKDAKTWVCFPDRLWTAVKSCFLMEVHLPLLFCLEYVCVRAVTLSTGVLGQFGGGSEGYKQVPGLKYYPRIELKTKLRATES